MKNLFERPRVVISKCIEFEHCRYNGDIITSETVKKLKPFIDFYPVCPEFEIGLGIPRNPIRITKIENKRRLIQPSTGKDYTENMNDFTMLFLDSLKDVDGFILKNRSPSCGIADVKIFENAADKIQKEKGPGFFGHAVLSRFSDLAIEDEGRMTNFKIREHFLTKIYLLASFRAVKRNPSQRALIDFQSDNKLLLMAYNQTEMRLLGKLVANSEGKNIKDMILLYETGLSKAFARSPRNVSNINVLMHGMGYFSKKLQPAEKGYFLDMLEAYRNGKAPLSTCTALLRSWIIRFEEQYLMRQTFFNPYPTELIEITNSGKGLDH